MEPVCISVHRHLSKFHPLHQILQYHCRGLIPVNVYGTTALLQSNLTIRPLFSYGTEGASQLLLKEYHKMVWNDIDLEVNLQVIVAVCHNVKLLIIYLLVTQTNLKV